MRVRTVLVALTFLLCSCEEPKDTSVKNSGVSLIPAEGNFTFVIKDTGNPLSGGSGNGDDTNNELWLKNDKTAKERLLVACQDAEKMENEICDIHNPQFSPDRSKVYFESSAWAVSGTIHMVDLNTGKERYVCPGDGLKVLRSGKYKGDFLTTMHKYYGPPNYGSYDHVFIVDDRGKELKDLGEEVDENKWK